MHCDALEPFVSRGILSLSGINLVSTVNFDMTYLLSDFLMSHFLITSSKLAFLLDVLCYVHPMKISNTDYQMFALSSVLSNVLKPGLTRPVQPVEPGTGSETGPDVTGFLLI